MSNPIKGRVAQLVSDREVIITCGSSHGVALGMVFVILDENTRDITDPETGEVLGSLRRIKVPIKITEVGEKISLAKTYRTKKVNVGGRGVGVGSLFAPPQWENRRETLRIDKGEGSPISEDESLVAVGDPVEEASEDIDSEIPSITLWH